MSEGTAGQNSQRSGGCELLKRLSSLMVKYEGKYVEGGSFEA